MTLLFPTINIKGESRFRRSKQICNNKRKMMNREKKRRVIEEVKTTSPQQNTINLSSDVLSPAEKSLLKKGQSFVPRPTDINRGNLPKCQ